MNVAEKTTSLIYRRSLAVRYETDVLVVGGGPAGIAAALAAKRQGVRVRLIEAHTCLGGMGTAGLVPAFMPFDDGINFLADGIGREVLDALRKAGGTGALRKYCNLTEYSIRTEYLKRVYDEMLVRSRIPFTFHTQLVDVTQKNGRVTEAICASKSGFFAIKARVFVDGTGDGDVAALAGAPFKKGDAKGKMMPGTLCSIWANIDWKRVEKGGLGSGNSRLEEAFKDGVFTLKDRHLSGMWRVGAKVGGANIGHTFDVDGTNEESLTRAFLWGRKSLLEYERYYKEYLNGFEKMELVATGSLLGVRETRRIIGDYVLCLEDFKKRAVFKDEIGRFSYPVDIHIARPDKASYEKFRKEISTLRMGNGESYGIPYRILTPKKLKNVLVAGRCVSTDRNLQASIRVMPGCYITGQAAGVAAAMVVKGKTDTRGVNVTSLQQRLKRMGAFLPNTE